MTGILSPANGTGMYGSGAFDSNETWLRGGWYVDTNGIVELVTIYPGYYDCRAPHIHLMVHKDWAESANGFVHVVPWIPVNLG